MQHEKEFEAGSVLVVDDASIMRVACERALKKAGFPVQTAISGEEGLESMEKNAAYAVLCDIRMPGISGVEFLKKVKSKWPKTEVVMMTAYADHDIAEESIKLGATEILIKPFDDIRIMIHAVTKALIRAKIQRQGNQLDNLTFEQLILLQQICSPEEIAEAKKLAKKNNMSLKKAITSLGLAIEEDLDWAAARFLEIPFVHLQEKILDRELINNFPPGMARKYLCLPLWREDGSLHLVMANPFDLDSIAVIELELGIKIKPAKAPEQELRELIDKFYGPEFKNQPIEQLADRMILAEANERDRILAYIFATAKVEQIREARVRLTDDNLCKLDLSLTLRLPRQM
jgi:CheY-like chemotaxis protein